MDFDEVKAWLETRLHSKYGADSADVRMDAKAVGITRGQLKQARKELKVKTVSLFDRSGRPTGEYKWLLR